MLVDGIGLEFDRVSTSLNALDAHDPGWWALGKLYTYRAQREPFVHLDNDVFLWRPLPERLASAPLLAQNPEPLRPRQVLLPAGGVRGGTRRDRPGLAAAGVALVSRQRPAAAGRVLRRLRRPARRLRPALRRPGHPADRARTQSGRLEPIRRQDLPQQSLRTVPACRLHRLSPRPRGLVLSRDRHRLRLRLGRPGLRPDRRHRSRLHPSHRRRQAQPPARRPAGGPRRPRSFRALRALSGISRASPRTGRRHEKRGVWDHPAFVSGGRYWT